MCCVLVTTTQVKTCFSWIFFLNRVLLKSKHSFFSLRHVLKFRGGLSPGHIVLEAYCLRAGCLRGRLYPGQVVSVAGCLRGRLSRGGLFWSTLFWSTLSRGTMSPHLCGNVRHGFLDFNSIINCYSLILYSPGIKVVFIITSVAQYTYD